MHIIFAFTVDGFLEIWRISAAHLDDDTFGLWANCALAVFGLCNDWKGTTTSGKMHTSSEMFEINQKFKQRKTRMLQGCVLIMWLFVLNKADAEEWVEML